MSTSKTDSNLQLTVEKRSPMKNASRKLKRMGQTPAVVYGSKVNNLHLSVQTNMAIKYSSSQFDNKIFTLQSKDKKINGLKVLKKDVMYDRLSRQPIHMDFLVLNMSQRIRVTVEIKFLGKAKGVKESGGVFNALKRNIEVECLPHEIPNFFEMDISELELNENYHVSDIAIPSNIKLVTRPEEALCSVSEAQEEIQETPATTPDSTEVSATTNTTSDEKPSDSPSSKKDSSKD